MFQHAGKSFSLIFWLTVRVSEVTVLERGALLGVRFCLSALTRKSGLWLSITPSLHFRGIILNDSLENGWFSLDLS